MAGTAAEEEEELDRGPEGLPWGLVNRRPKRMYGTGLRKRGGEGSRW